MAELLVMVVDKISDDPYKDAQQYKRGFVVEVCPDGWPWSPIERTHSMWRILAFPGVDVSTFAKLLNNESAQRLIDNPADQTANPARNRVLQRRAFRIAPENLTVAQRNAIMAFPRLNNGILTVPKAAIDNVTLRLAPLADPGVIG